MTAVDEDLLSQLLAGAVGMLDIPDKLYELAVDRYEDVGNWLSEHGGSSWEIYPQGSFRLGTVVHPDASGSEYDIDLVCLLDVAKEDVSQVELKARVGDMLASYLGAKIDEGAVDSPDDCVEGRRCWTLHYSDYAFHLDVLPAIPDVDRAPSGIHLTDTKLTRWQDSDPIRYARWFRSRSEEMMQKLAKRALEANVAEVPEWKVRTTLQRLVQVLKWHCALHFANDVENRPPSILITTLAAHAYRGESDLFVATLDAVRHMPDFVVKRSDTWWVPNPVNDGENFADKWADYPERRLKFIDWLEQVTSELNGLTDVRGRGFQTLVERVGEAFDASTIRKAAGQIGDKFRTTSTAGGLAMTGRGILTKGNGVNVRKHTFYGDSHR